MALPQTTATPAVPDAPLGASTPGAGIGEIAAAANPRVSVSPAELPVTVPNELPEKLAPVAQAGVELAKWVLGLMGVVIALCVVWLVITEVSFAREIADLVGKPDSKEAVAEVTSQLAATRDFFLKVAQMILLNILLPVLTALLGYIFGTNRAALSGGARG